MTDQFKLLREEHDRYLRDHFPQYYLNDEVTMEDEKDEENTEEE